MTEFILITFYNTTENEQYLHFCQWNGNEEALSTLQWLTHYIPDDILISDTPSLTYTINIHVKFSEESVNQFLRIDSNTTFNTSYPLITKCYGTLSLPAQVSPSAISDISEFRRFEYIPDLIHHCKCDLQVLKLFSLISIIRINNLEVNVLIKATNLKYIT
jgi:hypothetical protein